MTFRVVLLGTLEPGAVLEQVQGKFAAMTGQPADVIVRLLAGVPTTIKRGLELQEAQRIAAAVRSTGAMVRVEDEATPLFTLDEELLTPAPTSNATVATPEPARAAARLPPAADAPTRETLYTAIIGPKNTVYYLRAFAKRDAGGRFLTWNWPACLFGFYWALHRKLWGFAFGSIALAVLFGTLAGLLVAAVVVLAHIELSDPTATYRLVGFVAGMLAGTFGNGLYHRKALRLLAETAHLTDPEERLAELRRRGGVWHLGKALLIVLGLVLLLVLALLLYDGTRSRDDAKVRPTVAAAPAAVANPFDDPNFGKDLPTPAPEPEPYRSPVVTAQDLMRRTNAAYSAGELDTSERLALHLLQEYPGTAGFAYNILGIIAMQRGDGITAITHLQAATKEEPHDAIIWANLGKAYWQEDDLAHAQSALREAARMAPNNTAIMEANAKLQALITARNRDAAWEAYRRREGLRDCSATTESLTSYADCRRIQKEQREQLGM